MAKKKLKDDSYEKENNKLTLVESPLSPKQIVKIFQRTPAQHIYSRPAKGGGTWDYVTGTYVKKILNFVFGWMWDFEVVEHGRETDQVWVLGKLTVKDKDRNCITKMQFGRADIKFKKGTKIPLDFGNDLKAASTDALKKCASELGIASDVYGKNEFKEIKSEKPEAKVKKVKDEEIDGLKKDIEKKNDKNDKNKSV